MEKRRSLKVAVFIAAISTSVFALQPNFVKTWTYNVDGAGNGIVSTEYNDGIGRSIQTKLKLSDDSDRVVCTYYDEVGRLRISTKTFADIQKPGEYLPGVLMTNGTGDASIVAQLKSSNLNDNRAFSETQYWDDPLGKVKSTIGPGAAYATATMKAWNFGVEKTELILNFNYLGVAYNSHFYQGFIVSQKTEAMLDALVQYMFDNATFTSPQYFLSITKDENGVYTQVLKDLFGRTLGTRNTVTMGGDEIIPGYEYDIIGNVVKEKPPIAATNPVDNTEYKYNTLGQIIWKKSPDQGEFTFDYNPDGSLYRKILWRGGTEDVGCAYIYDAIGRQIRIEDLIMGHASYGVVQYFYDDFATIPKSLFSGVPNSLISEMTNLKNRLVASIAINRGLEKTIEVGQLYSYDDEGRVNQKITVMSGSPIFQETDFEYDLHGKLMTEYFSYSGDRIKKKFTYDKLGRLEKVIQGIWDPGTETYVSEKELVQYNYDWSGKLTDKKLTPVLSGIYHVWNNYDIRDRLANITSGSQGFEETIGYSAVSNVNNAQYVYNFGPGNVTTYNCSYDYDQVNRLSSATINDGTTSYSNAYEYDVGGRFKSKKEPSSDLSGYSYYTGTNRLKNTSKNPGNGQEYIYDKHGNTAVDFMKKMVVQYDWRNLPLTYWFYNDLSTAGLTKDAAGVFNITDKNLYGYMVDKVKDGTVQLISKVIMAYDAEGNRVCKMEVQE